MVIDQLQNASQYYGLGGRIEQALRYLQSTDFSQVAPGRYELDGANLFALVQEYDSKPKEKGFWEAHRQYMDVQYVFRGEELIGYANLAHLQTGEYDESRDFLPLQGEGEFMRVRAGGFMILAPQDAHMPGIASGEPSAVKKVVVKVRL